MKYEQNEKSMILHYCCKDFTCCVYMNLYNLVSLSTLEEHTIACCQLFRHKSRVREHQQNSNPGYIVLLSATLPTKPSPAEQNNLLCYTLSCHSERSSEIYIKIFFQHIFLQMINIYLLLVYDVQCTNWSGEC